MSVNESIRYKQTTVNQPQVQNTVSKQSLSASEDYYYSLSENASSGSSASGDGNSDNRSLRTVIPYTTPPSRNQSASQILERHEEFHSTPSLPLRSPQRIEAIRTPPNAPSPQPDAHPNTPKVFPSPQPSRMSNTQSPEHMEPERSPPTPGVDDTPYIRFAIEQLTRDEEIRGSRQYATVSRPAETYPVERIVPDEGLGYTATEQRQSYVSREERAEVEPSVHSQSSDGRDIFEPFDPPYDSLQYPPLTFMPRILRPLWLGLFIFICILVLILLIFAGARSMMNDGLWDYNEFGGERYFLFRYFPTLIGTLILLWLFQIQIALHRLVPYMAMASTSARFRSEGIFLKLYPNQFLLPNLEYFRAGKPLLGVCSLIFWIFMLTVPLLASAFSVRFYLDLFGGQWRWVAVEGVIWSAVALYILLIIALILLGLMIWGSETGLRWDPRSLADIIALLERSNIMNDYMGTETCTTKKDLRFRLPSRVDRLGYWHTTKRSNDIFYGIGEEGGMTRRYSVEQGKIREKGQGRGSMHVGGDFDVEQQEFRHSFRYDLRAPDVRFRYVPWFLKSTFVIGWIVSALVLFIAFLVVSFVSDAVRDGFDPQVDVASDPAGFSESNFIYSFFPALIGLLLYVLIISLDLVYRRLQPFVELSKIGGSPAEKSLLLDYTARLPWSSCIVAASHSHFRVAILSLVSLLALPIPVIAGGVFWTQFYASDLSVRVAAHMPAFYALCAFLALYLIFLFLAYPSRTHRLPHDNRCIAQLVSWLYMSRLLSDPGFHRVEGKADLVARLVSGVRSSNSLQAHQAASVDATAAATTASNTNNNNYYTTSNNNNYSRKTYNTNLGPLIDPTNSAAGPSRPRATFANPLARFPAAMLSSERLSLTRRANRNGSAATGYSNGTGRNYSNATNGHGYQYNNNSANPVTLPPMQGPSYASQIYAEPDIKYGFGIMIGRDGREHLGIDRVKRVGARMTFFEESARASKKRRRDREKGRFGGGSGEGVEDGDVAEESGYVNGQRQRRRRGWLPGFPALPFIGGGRRGGRGDSSGAFSGGSGDRLGNGFESRGAGVWSDVDAGGDDGYGDDGMGGGLFGRWRRKRYERRMERERAGGDDDWERGFSGSAGGGFGSGGRGEKKKRFGLGLK